MNNNIEFNYLYRDASNYKSWGTVIFSNPYNIPIEFINSTLKKYFDFGEYFIADQICIPEVFLYSDGNINIDDHCYHEIVSIRETSKKPNDIKNRSIDTFIEQVKNESSKGWKLFEPGDKYIIL